MANQQHKGNILGIQHLLEHLAYTGFLNKPDAHVRAWFRGHTDESWDLVPGVYRSDFPAKTEDERLNLERVLTNDFRVMSAGLLRAIRPGEEEAQLYFVQQHYRMRTRLLDWTNNALAGLYFAVSSHFDKDGALFVMDAYELGPSQGADFERVFTSREPIFQEALKEIFHWPAPACRKFPGFIFPVRPDYFDPRITLQRGCFTFHVPQRQALTLAENRTLQSFRIPCEKKREIAKDLAILGIDDFSIFGDLEHLSNRLKAAYGIP
jgi:hypothetical protein